MELYLSLFTPLSFFLRGEQRHEIKIRRKNWPVRRMFALAGPEAFIYSLTRSPCLSISLFLLSPPSFSFRKRKHGRSISLRWAAISFLFYSFLSLSFRLAVKFSVSRDCRTLPARETRLRSLSLFLRLRQSGNAKVRLARAAFRSRGDREEVLNGNLLFPRVEADIIRRERERSS